MASTEPALEVLQILWQWEEEHSSANYDPTNHLQRLAEIIELETENYYKMDLDPFDERHPSHTDPECNFRQILKVLFRKDTFMNKLINDYLRDSYFSKAGINGKDVRKLNIAACRVMLDILPGLETSTVFQPDMDGLVNRLFSWAEKDNEPLQSYATGLLGDGGSRNRPWILRAEHEDDIAHAAATAQSAAKGAGGSSAKGAREPSEQCQAVRSFRPGQEQRCRSRRHKRWYSEAQDAQQTPRER